MPLDKIVCFGKNYSDHIKEMGDKPNEKPVIFLKTASVLKQCPAWNETLNVNLTAEETHYECELVIKLRQGGYRMSVQQAKEAIGWHTVGLDMTLRKLQAQLKKDGNPWTISKVFPDSGIIGPWLDAARHDYLTEQFTFTLDGTLRQQTCGNNMLFSPIELIVHASQFFPLCEGDILFTGTPSGVGKVEEGSTGIVAIGEHKYTVSWTTGA